MSIELSVGPPALTINHGSTFMVTDLRGEIDADSEHGLFTDDTRFLSYYALFANGRPWVLLTSAATTHYFARVYLTNNHFKTEDSAIEAGTLALVVERIIGEGLHEDLSVTNHGLGPVRFNLELALRSDFADIFEVKAHDFVRRGHIVTEWDAFRALDFARLKERMAAPVLVDLRNIYPPEDLQRHGFTYVSVGRTLETARE